LRGSTILCLASLVLLGIGLVGGSAAAAPETLRPGKADKVVVLKGERRLLLLRADRVLGSYGVALGRNPRGEKTSQGDGRTPEGRYVLDWRTPDSRFYRAIHVSYPNSDDRRRARRLGVVPGGDIMIHGLPNGLGEIGAAHLNWDWTEGCIAVTNAEMDEIWAAIDDGTPIEIRP
jgi:murein L,D-transpeptidase YafK